MSNQTIDPTVEALANHVGVFIDYWGFKAIEGKIWCLTYISNKPLGPSDYIQAFGISKGLVSQSVKRLIDYKVLVEVSESGKKKQFYKTNDDLVDVVKGVLKVREYRILADVESTARKVEKSGSTSLEKKGIDIEKVKQVAELTEVTKSMLEIFMNDDCSQSLMSVSSKSTL